MGFSQKIGSIFVEIFADKSKLTQALKEVQSDSEKAGKRIEQNMQSASKSFDLVGQSVEQLRIQLTKAEQELANVKRTMDSVGKKMGIADFAYNNPTMRMQLGYDAAIAKVETLKTQLRELGVEVNDKPIELKFSDKLAKMQFDEIETLYKELKLELAKGLSLNLDAKSIAAIKAQIAAVEKILSGTNLTALNKANMMEFNNSIAVMKIEEVKALYKSLEEELAHKISINADSASIELTKAKIASVKNALREVNDEAMARKAKIDFDDSLAKMKIIELQALLVKLRAEFAEKLKLNVSQGSLVETQSQIKSVERALNNVGVATKEVSKVSVNEVGKIERIWNSLFIRLAGYFVIYKTAAFLKDSVQAAAAIEGVRRKFDQLNQPNLLDKLRQATRGAVSDLKLMETATKAASFGISGDLLAKGLEFAGKQARQTGQDVNYLVDSFVMGIGMKSTRRLDNLQIKLQDIQTEVKKTGGNFEEAIGNIIDRRLKEMGDVSETAADKFAQFQTKIENLKVAVGDELIPAMEPLLNIFEKDIDGAEKFGAASSTLGGIVRVLATSIALVETNLNSVGIALGTVGATLAKTLQVLYTYTKAAFEVTSGNYLGAMSTIETGAKLADIWDIANRGIKMYVNNLQTGFDTLKKIATNPSLNNLAHTYTNGKPSTAPNVQPLLSTAVSDEMEGLKTQTDLIKTNYLLGEATKKQYIDALKNEKDELENLKKKTLLTSDYAKVQARILAVAQELSSKGTKEVRDLQKEVDNFYKSLSLNDNNAYQNALNNLKKQRDEYLKTVKDKSEVDKWYNEEFAKLQSDRAKAHDDELNKTLNAITLTQEYYDLTDTNDKIKIQNAIDYIDKLEKESKTSEFLNKLLKERKELEDKLRKAGTPITNIEGVSLFNPTMSKVGGVPKITQPGLSQDEEEQLLLDKIKKQYGAVGTIVANSMQSVENSFATNVTHVIEGQENLATAIKNIWAGILDTIIETAAKILAQYAMIGLAKAVLGPATGGASMAVPVGNMVGSPTVSTPSVGSSPVMEKGFATVNNSIQALNMNMMNRNNGTQIIVQTSDPSTKVIEKYVGVQNRMALNGANLSDYVNGK